MIITDWMLRIKYWEDFCNELVELINRHPNRNAKVKPDRSRTKIQVIDDAVPTHDGERRINGWERA